VVGAKGRTMKAVKKIEFGTIIKLAIWSLIVGFILYNFSISPGDIYGWVANTIAGFWEWIANSGGIEYMLLGATIVVPIYLIFRFKNRNRG